MSNHELYAEEAKERWGGTAPYKESQKRLANYSKDDIAKAGAQMDIATQEIKNAFLAGLAANSTEAMAGAEAHRLAISNWWYECSKQMHQNLGDMYLADPRFMENYENLAPGFAQYMHDAIYANASKQ
jgi:hypothetical protein